MFSYSHETINLATGNTDHGHISPVYKPLERLELACWYVLQIGGRTGKSHSIYLQIKDIVHRKE